MESFLIKAAQFALALSLLVFIHELGHYVAARIFGMKVDKFYLFFNPWFSLFKYKPKNKKNPDDPDYRPTWRDTTYGIGWVPLGGYCQISGMIDESMDKEQMKQPAKPWEFRSKPAWQRLIVMAAGVIMNFVLAILIYAGIAIYWGEKYIELDKAYEGLEFSQTALDAGFRNGDIPLLADGKALDYSSSKVMMDIAEAHEVTVLRDGDTTVITLPKNFLLKLNDKAGEGFYSIRIPVIVKETMSGEPAAKAGLLPGDRIVSVDTIPARAFNEFTQALLANKGRETLIGFYRGDSLMYTSITPTEAGKIGIMLTPVTDIYPVVMKQYGMLSALPRGWQMGVEKLTAYVSSMKYVATKEGVQSLGGFGAIASMFEAKWNWLAFWEITAFLSVALAFMNIIPIPALDGGHIMFTLWEVITRRKVSERVLEVAQYIGMFFLLTLLLYANGNDIFRFFFK